MVDVSRQSKVKAERVNSISSRQSKRGFLGLRQVKTESDVTAIKKVFPFGLDMGTNSIKLVQLGCDQQGKINIVNSAIEELPKEVQRYNSKERQDLLTSTLKKIIEDKGLEGDCFVNAPYIYTRVRLIKLPPMPTHEIDKAVQWEIRESTRLDLEELCFDYIILDPQKIKFLGNQIDVLVITALKKNIFTYLSLLESAGLRPQAIDIEPLADLAVLNYTKEARFNDEVVLFLDFGAGKTSLNIIYNNELIFLRYLNVSGNSLTKALSEYLRLSWEESELMKKNFGLLASEDKAIQVRNAISPLLENMAQDIEHTFKYFSYQVSQSQIKRFNKIILSGGSSYLKDLLSFLRKRLNTEVELIDTLSNFVSLEPSISPAHELSARLNISLGLALRGLE